MSKTVEMFNPKSQVVTPQTIVTRAKFPVFDMHTHMGALIPGVGYETLYDTDEYVRTLKEKNIKRIINLDGFWGHELEKIKLKTESHPSFIQHFMWIDWDRFDDDDFEEVVSQHIDESVEKGAIGIKMWKDISLYRRDKNGNPIRTDDPRVSFIYHKASEHKIPVLIHIADPVAFFDPLDERNERLDELGLNPEWSFADETQNMSFEALMQMQETMIKNHPKTQFIVAHVGSYAENLGYVSQQLDVYPNLSIDISARIAELGRVPYAARRFFITYQDRIMFGSDCSPGNTDLLEAMFRFLETDDEYFHYDAEPIPYQGRWRIYGIFLPDDVLKKIYYENAERIIGNPTIKQM